MRAGLIGRQRLPVQPRELVEMGVAGGVADRGHAHLDQAVGRLCRRGLHGVAVTSFTNMPPAAAPGHRAPKPVCQLSGLRYACRERNPTGGKAKRIPDGPERRAARPTPRGRAPHQRPPRPKDRMRRRDRRQREDGLSDLANSTLSAGLLGLVLALIPRSAAPAQAQGAPTGAAPSRPWLDPTPARGGQGGRLAHRLLVDQRAGRPAAVQVVHRRDRHQGRICARIRRDPDVAHGDRVSRRSEILRHRADRDDQQDAAANAGSLRAARGRQHLRRMPAIRTSAGMASTPTTIRRPTTPGRSRPRSCRRATRSLPSIRNGPARSPSTAPTTNGSRRSCSITASRRASSW